MNKILVVAVNWLGDVIFSMPVYRAIKARYPKASVSVLCVPRVSELFKLCPDVDHVIVYDEDGDDRPLVSKLFLVEHLRREKFDAAFLLRRSLSRTALCAAAGIPERVGFAGKGWAWLLTRVVEDAGCDALHRSDVYLRVVESFGIPAKDRRYQLVVSDQEKSVARSWLGTHGLAGGERAIAVNTGGNWDLKQWPAENFVELVRMIRERSLGRVVLTGGAKDVARVCEIAAASGSTGPQPIIAAGETSLTGLAALMTQMNVLVTADTGPLHLANAVGVPVVALFGPTRPEITGSRGSGKAVILQHDVGCNRAPCYFLECSDNKCMKAIGVNDVLQALGSILR